MKYAMLTLIIVATFLPWGYPTSAQTQAWLAVSTPTAPPARYDHVLIAAEDFGVAVLFGGQNGSDFLSDTWILDLNTLAWRAIETPLAPDARHSMSAAYDLENGRVLLFAGQANGLFNDVWAFDLTTETWSELNTSGTTPVARYGSSAVVAGNQLIISHGFATGRFDDTLALDLVTNTWLDLTPQIRPMARCLHEAAFDPLSGQMVLFGGCSSGIGPCPQGDTWSFDPIAGIWTEVTTSADSPNARYNPALVNDGAGLFWLFGGDTENGRSNDLWTFDGVNWIVVSAAGAPPTRSNHDMLWDGLNSRLVVFGGRGDNGPLNDLWVFQAEN